jgi:hypothetical protein
LLERCYEQVIEHEQVELGEAGQARRHVEPSAPAIANSPSKRNTRTCRARKEAAFTGDVRERSGHVILPRGRRADGEPQSTGSVFRAFVVDHGDARRFERGEELDLT